MKQLESIFLTWRLMDDWIFEADELNEALAWGDLLGRQM